MNKTIVMLIGKGVSSRYLYHALQPTFAIDYVIVEESISRKWLIQRRVKKLGWRKVVGQLLFQLTVPRLLQWMSTKRIEALKMEYQLQDKRIDATQIRKVSSVNSEACIRLLKSIQPDLILVNGTRIIAPKVLDQLDAVLVNTHLGITPAYRGAHGGYWALANKDQAHFGVTIHWIDRGIDTGGIVAQQVILPTPHDNFYTYPLLQLGEGIQLLKEVLPKLLEGDRSVLEKPTTKSKLWYHPTLWSYLKNWIFYGVK